MKDYQKIGITRRDFLKKGAIVVASGLFGQLVLHEPFVKREASAQAAQKRIYIAPDDHTDYFWSTGEAQYRDAFLDMIDYYLELTDRTIGNSSEYQSRWNCDGSFWLWVYEKNRTTAQFERLMNRVKDGHISFPMTPLVLVAGGAPTEAILRGLYYAGSLERRFNLRVPLAVAMENQTLPLGLGMLWAGSGAKYSWKGICGCDSLIPNAWDRPKEIYWWVGLDGSKILMKWNSMLGGLPGSYPNQGLGGYAEARNPGESINFVDTNSQFISRYPYRIIGIFGKGWDDIQTTTDEFVTTAVNKTNASRKVIVSNEQDFFEDFEKTYASEIGSLTCSFGNEWDLYVATLAAVTADVKRSVEKMRTAEALAALVSLISPDFMTSRQEERAQAWMDMGLYWEHNFGMVNPQSWDKDPISKRIEWQRRLSTEIKNYINKLHADSLQTLETMITTSGSKIRFFTFNPLGWARTGTADYPYAGPGPLHVVDLSNGQEVPSQFVTISGVRSLRILASNVPAVGYKVFEIRTGAGQFYSNAATVNGGTIENSVYRLTVTGRGAITSWIDKTRMNRELVRLINGLAMNDLGAGSGSLQVENAGPVSVTLLAKSSSPLSHQSRITLYRDAAWVDIQNEINENFSSTAIWSFGMELSSPDTWHEEVGAILHARLLEQGGHYSDLPDTARYDWLTLNHFVDMTGNGPAGVTLSNADCCFMKLGDSTTDKLDTSTPQISVLAGGKVANGDNGLPRQGGDRYFLQRFALRSHDAYNQVEAMSFAMEHQNPLVTGRVNGGKLPEKSFSLINISSSAILLWALKPADDAINHSVIARVWNLSNNASTFDLSIPEGQLNGAQHVTHIETPVGPATATNGKLVDTLAVQQIKSFALDMTLPFNPAPRHCEPMNNKLCKYFPIIRRR